MIFYFIFCSVHENNLDRLCNFSFSLFLSFKWCINSLTIINIFWKFLKGGNTHTYFFILTQIICAIFLTMVLSPSPINGWWPPTFSTFSNWPRFAILHSREGEGEETEGNGRERSMVFKAGRAWFLKFQIRICVADAGAPGNVAVAEYNVFFSIKP